MAQTGASQLVQRGLGLVVLSLYLTACSLLTGLGRPEVLASQAIPLGSQLWLSTLTVSPESAAVQERCARLLPLLLSGRGLELVDEAASSQYHLQVCLREHSDWLEYRLAQAVSIEVCLLRASDGQLVQTVELARKGCSLLQPGLLLDLARRAVNSLELVAARAAADL